MKAAAPVLVALLVLSLPAMAVVAAGPAADDTRALAQATVSDGLVEADGTTNRLTLEGDVHSGYLEPGTDLGATLGVRDDALRADHARYTLESEFDDLPADERREAIDTAYELTSERIHAIEERERDAVRAHANGAITDEQLLATLVRNYNAAAELDDVLEEVGDYADRTSGYDGAKIGHAEMTLEVFYGDVRGDLDAVARGESVSTRDVVVDTSENGHSVAMIDGNTYVRETTRFDNRQPAEPDGIGDIDAADTRFQDELYPWAFDNRVGGSQHNEAPTAQLYSARTSTPQGDLSAYLDGATGAVYHEVQSLSIDGLPVDSREETWTNDSLELSINETPVNGPIEVTVVDAETGEPVDATIAADGYELGETGDDGSMWLLTPAGGFELAAEADGNSLEVTVAE